MKFCTMIVVVALLAVHVSAQVMTSAAPAQDTAVVTLQSAEVLLIGSANAGLLPSTIQLSGVPGVASCCPEYTTASGWVAGVDLGAELVVAQSMSLFGTLGVAWMQPSTTADEVVPLNDRFETVDGTIRHTIEVSTFQLVFGAGVSVRLIDGFRVLLAPSIMIPLSATFTQTEELIEPQTVEFNNGQRTWNNTDGPLTVSPTIAIGIGVQYLFSVSTTVQLGPQIWYHYSFADMIPNWRVSRATAGLAVAIAP